MNENLLKARAYIDYIELVDFVKSKDWTLSSLFAVLNGHNLNAIDHLFDCNYKSICATIREGMYGCYVDLTIEVWDDKHLDTIGCFNAKDLAKYVSMDTVDKQKMVCGHCKEEFDQDPDDTVFYNGKPICDHCYQRYYGYCEVCQELHPYDEMLFADGNYCEQCIYKLVDTQKENERLKEEIKQLKGEK